MWTWPLFWKAPNGVKLNFLAFYLTLHLEISKSPDLFFLKKQQQQQQNKPFWRLS